MKKLFLNRLFSFANDSLNKDFVFRKYFFTLFHVDHLRKNREYKQDNSMNARHLFQQSRRTLNELFCSILAHQDTGYGWKGAGILIILDANATQKSWTRGEQNVVVLF